MKENVRGKRKEERGKRKESMKIYKKKECKDG